MQNDDVCGPLVQQYQTAMSCLSQEMSCEELDSATAEGGSPSKGQPCFEEYERATKALDEAKKREPEKAEGCAFAYALSVMAAQEGAIMGEPEEHGIPCTTAEDCPDIQCADPERGGQVCADGTCAPEDVLCD
ncbi:hypothetical protein BE20_31625 [Sorangium cellulosum]|uniref:Uncharacterized protein n=1 Tax=Sorangium cellulosum TaxID=56 RepID=A0A150RYD2_SORCE|nr:hypothetical protein BE18_47575 [Sorangium cellulosum]KYF99367.1 hypothetical protein BE20_31625 [Sorangium cellulosum]